MKALLAVAGIETIELGLHATLGALALIGAGTVGVIAGGIVVVVGVGIVGFGALVLREATGYGNFIFKDDKK